MKQIAALAVIAIGLAACQTTAQRPVAVDLPAPAMPQDFRPIAGEATLGSEPVAGAFLTETRRMALRQRGQSGLLTVKGLALVDTSRNGRLVSLRIVVVDVETEAANVRGDNADTFRRLLEGTSGDVVEYRMDVPTALTTVTITHQGETTTRSSEPGLGLLALLRLPNLAGQTISQDRELIAYRMGDLFPSIGPELADLTYSARAVGETTHNGRPAIVVQTSGAIILDGTPLQIAGLILIDRLTGAALYSETRLASMVPERTSREISITQRLALR